VQAHKLAEYKKQDLADFRRFFTNIVQKDEHFLDRRMKVCDACCTRFYAAADESMSVEMTKLVVGAADGVSNRNLQSSLRRSVKSRASLSLSKSLQLESSTQVIKSITIDQYLPNIKGAGSRQRSHTALGLAGLELKHKDDRAGAVSADPAGRRSLLSAEGSAILGSLSRDDLQTMTTGSKKGSTRNVRVHAKNVREWIRYFYEEADMKNTSSRTSMRNTASPYQMPIPFKE